MLLLIGILAQTCFLVTQRLLLAIVRIYLYLQVRSPVSLLNVVSYILLLPSFLLEVFPLFVFI